MRAPIVGLITLPLLLLHWPANAVEPLPVSELYEHCALYGEDPEGKDAIFCVRYIQGFIDGAIATDERVLQNVRAEYEDLKESFTERAIRMRAPRDHLVERFGATSYADICLGEPVPLLEVVTKITGDLTATAGQWQDESAREVVFENLRKHYPCDK
ncbi:MAG: Rap1a/Tai family immunity protein [Pseudomonadales bacterium]